MSEDTPLIQVNDGEEEAVNDEEKIDFKQMVWFHGKASAPTLALCHTMFPRSCVGHFYCIASC